MHYFTHLACRECGHTMEIQPVAICEHCFGPVEVIYDYQAIVRNWKKESLENRAFTMWRYQELLPVTEGPRTGYHVGGTPLIAAKNLSKKWGIKNLYIKNDAVNFPTLSFKDRVVAVALSSALEFGFQVVGCASTGNLANSVAAQAAMAGLQAYIFIPHDLEPSKISATACYTPNLIQLRGTYDDVNRLCSEIAYEFNWGFVNINLRPFYAEGSKTLGFEIAEQLNWQIPDAVVVPMAGGSLINKIYKAFDELVKIGWCESKVCKFFGAQASGCNPITAAVKSNHNDIIPQKPRTIAKSLAIGNPADGYYAAKTILKSGGWGEDVTDEEIIHGIELLAETEGIFTETAGGVTVAVAKKLIHQGRIQPDDLTVLCITGNGLKTQELFHHRWQTSKALEPSLDVFKKHLKSVLNVNKKQPYFNALY